LLDTVAADLPATGLRVDAVLCSAAMHLLDEAVVFPRVAQILRPGGVFAFNLWWHSFDETAPDEPESWWEQVVDEEVRQAGFATPEPPAWTPARERTRSELVQLAASHGLALRSLVRDTDDVAAAFFVDFAAMRPDWLADLGEARAAVLERARARCTRPVQVVTVRLLFARSCVEAA
jgi:SAM-dependent methyltransferase